MKESASDKRLERGSCRGDCSTYRKTGTLPATLPEGAPWSADLGQPSNSAPTTAVDGQPLGYSIEGGDKMTETVELKHGDLVICNGRKGIVGTVAGYAAEYGEDAEAAIQRAKERGHWLTWANQQATILCGDPGFYEAERERWSKAIPITDGQIVMIETHIYEVKYMGDYSDMVHFILIEEDETSELVQEAK